jgi:thiamine-monophosphate kinase
VTGTLGGSLAGRHLSFQPRLDEALELASRCDLHAMIDLSDGLSTDLLHLADASDVGVRVEGARVPVSADAQVMAGESGRTPLSHALSDGEDYELLFCVSMAEAEELEQSGLLEVSVTRVGRIVENPHVRRLTLPDGTEEELTPQGWEHLKNNG